MFRCTRYVRNKPQNVELELDENDEDNHSSTDTLRTRYHELEPEASLKSQLQHDNCRGKILVSGEYSSVLCRGHANLVLCIACANSAFADSIRNIVATKALHLHEHEFRPEKWPRMEKESVTAKREYPSRNGKPIKNEYQSTDLESIKYSDLKSARDLETVGYKYGKPKETYRYSAN
jgi:hypothetical protein